MRKWVGLTGVRRSRGGKGTSSHEFDQSEEGESRADLKVGVRRGGIKGYLKERDFHD